MATLSDNFGTCWSCTTGLTFPSKMASGFRVVAEAIVRRWSTAPGGLIDDPNYGRDLTGLISMDLSKTEIAALSRKLSAEAEKDERVLSCSVTVTLVSGNLTAKALVKTAAGPFNLVLSVNQLTVALLQPSA